MRGVETPNFVTKLMMSERTVYNNTTIMYSPSSIQRETNLDIRL